MASALSLVRSAQTPHPSALAAGEGAGEDALVGRARRGDVDAFERLYHLHAGRVYALCLRLAGEPMEARELVQDTFVHAWEALPRFRGESSLTTWLHRIAVNAMLERRRRDRRRSARVALVEDEDDVEGAPIAGGFVAPTDVATAIDLERAIAALPPGVRRAFVLHEVEGYTHEEVAGMTGLATGTLRAQLHRARQLLIRALSL
jgi:RNA polymerase sigma-70 factor (ECF subfamily)